MILYSVLISVKIAYFSVKFIKMKKSIVLVLFPFLMFGQTQIGDDIYGNEIGDFSGLDISLSSNGNIVAIRSPSYNDNSASYVSIYENIAGVWTQIGNKIYGETEYETFGSNNISLSSNGDTIALGVFNNGENSGYVHIYKNIGNIWTQVGDNIIGEAIGDRSGRSVSLSNDGSTVAIGAPKNDGNVTDSGHVRIYKYESENWIQIGDDIDGESANDDFGWSVSLSDDGSVVAIGAIDNDGNGSNSGHVRVFLNESGEWTQIGEDIDGEFSGDRFGWGLSLSSNGGMVAVGATYNDGNGNSSGHVRIYENIGGTWTQIGDDIDGEDEFDLFGFSVSLSSNGNILAIGASSNNGNGVDSGQVRIYQYIAENWIKVGIDIDGKDAYNYFGFSVSLSDDGSIVAVGGPNNDDNGENAGHVRVYDLSQILSLNSQLEENNFTINPNPASENISINLKENQEVNLINIYNNLGQLVQTATKTSIDISALATGSYYVQVTTNERISARKLLIK